MGLPRHTPARTALRAALAVCVLGTLPGCTQGSPQSPPAPSGPKSAADICTDLVAYWVKEALKGSKWAGLDWEQKGLSNEQLTVHDEVLAAARQKERTDGRDAALTFADEESRRRCAAANGATGSSENWRPPGSTPSPGPSSTPPPTPPSP
ncbi:MULTISPECIES: hypothetical protein [Streptomyces]|uniref:Lipoprotein n=1 Tax=Streptomyces solicathayae TaxID=3081768 RepID=A0ABZ0M0C5_9ACTN|nr:hypothetical protein [Streptomyces sp. HUAS YS2]WOX25010.1 hypothetical protein R2D22_27945 [Streptomyces sp. HUAS YS2]